MKKIITSAAVAMALLLSGCATQVYTLQDGAVTSPDAVPTVNQRQHFFVSGLGQTKHLNAAKICGGIENVAKSTSRATDESHSTSTHQSKLKYIAPTN